MVMHVDKFFSQGSAPQYANHGTKLGKMENNNQAQDLEMQKKFNYPLHIQEDHKLLFS